MSDNYVTVEGKAGIVAKVIADSVASKRSYNPGKRITTFEITYPRIVHAESRTHRMVSMSDDEVMILSGQNCLMSDPMLSRNAASSRAIPFAKMKEQLTGRPVRFGQANPGMQDKGVDFDANIFIGHDPEPFSPETAWEYGKQSALKVAEAYYKAGYAKQVYNRGTEPYQMIKVVVTATEWNNFFWLRDEGDGPGAAPDPTIAELARCMKEAREKSVPQELNPGEWHLPYVSFYDGEYILYGEDHNYIFITLENAIQVSSARCAAVSFRNTDYGLEKSQQVFERLVGDERKHGSALEHQATPMGSYSISSYGTNDTQYTETWQQGISHADREGNLWSGNFNGWIQHRKLIAGENMEG